MGTLNTKTKAASLLPGSVDPLDKVMCLGSKMFIFTTVVGLGLCIAFKSPSQDRLFRRDCSNSSASKYSNIQISRGQTTDFVSASPEENNQVLWTLAVLKPVTSPFEAVVLLQQHS